MNNHERAARLMIEAGMNGTETPTESAIATAIHEAEQETVEDCMAALLMVGMKQAAAVLERHYQRLSLEDAG
jgi:hypothetical protein